LCSFGWCKQEAAVSWMKHSKNKIVFYRCGS
jgi:hypothetical protein